MSNLKTAIEIMGTLPGSRLVGGMVRSYVLDLPANSDIDLLVTRYQGTALDYLAAHVPDGIIVKSIGKTTRVLIPKFHTAVDLTVTGESTVANMSARDFTINAMAIYTGDGGDICVANLGTSLQDAKNHVLDTMSDPASTILADPQRIVRAVRFIAQLSHQTGHQWKLAPRLFKVLRAYPDTIRDLLTSHCNNSRLRNEVEKVLRCAPPGFVLDSLTYTLGDDTRDHLFRLVGGRLHLKG